jgi:hypothetical protein
MITTDPRDTLAVFEQRARELHAGAEAERLRGPSAARRAIAGSLRRVADRLDPGPRGWAPTSMSLGADR